MDYNMQNFVEGIGVANPCDYPSEPHYFTETCIYDVVCLPEQKPDIEQLISVMADVEVVSVRVVHTPGGPVETPDCMPRQEGEEGITSPEGQRLLGCKLSLELLIKQKIKYIADEPTQSVHAAHFETTMASVFVVVPCKVGGGPGFGEPIPIETLLRQGKIDVTPYIEHIYGEQRGKRCVFKNITLFINVKFRTQ